MATKAPPILTWRELGTRVLTGGALYVLGCLALAVVLCLAVLVSVPVIWIVATAWKFWGWWAHTWGILGY